VGLERQPIETNFGEKQRTKQAKKTVRRPIAEKKRDTLYYRGEEGKRKRPEHGGRPSAIKPRKGK